MRIRSRKLLVVSVALGLLLAGSLAFSPYVRIRVERRVWLLKLKLQGSLSHASWDDVLRTMPPGGVMRGGKHSYEFMTSPKQQGPEPCPVLWETPMGEFWGRNSDRTLLKDLTFEQLFDQLYQRKDVQVRPGDVVLDAGSHLGTFSRYALDRGASLVVAFEPDPVNIECFKRTFRQEIANGRVILVEAAVWHEPGVLRFSPGSLANTGAGMIAEAGEVEVPATTLDDTVARLGLDRVDFVKMDIEGSERHALRGDSLTLSRFGPRMAISVYHRDDDPEVIPEVVLQARPTYQVQFTDDVKIAYFH